ncbi:DUF3616 domain-containing protein, partial [Xanthomonas oryzae]
MAKKTLIPYSVRRELAPGALVHSNLSGAAFTDDWLWVAGDEACAVDRLRKLGPVQRQTLRFGEGQSFPLADLLDLSGEDGEEADLEGMGLSDGFLWVIGSHGSKGKNAEPGRDDAENAKRLTKLKLDGNRRLLACLPACLPIEQAQDGSPHLVREAADGRRSLRLKGDAKHNQLTDLLADDPHFGPFLKIPGKDNGFDIEGIVVDGQRLLLGLRGPVLRGWSAMLEIQVEAHGDHLRLMPLDDDGTLLRKHFLQLGGLGICDLHYSGDDLYLLAGPTMVLNCEIRLFKWPGARTVLAADQAPVRFQHDLLESAVLPHGKDSDRAEAICNLPKPLACKVPTWLVLYD